MTLVAMLFVAAGVVGVAYHATEINLRGPFEYEVVWALLVRCLAVIAGVFMFRGANWARWLALAWMAYHVVLSAFHSGSEAAMHLVLLAVIAFVLLRPQASAYFQGAGRSHG